MLEIYLPKLLARALGFLFAALASVYLLILAAYFIWGPYEYTLAGAYMYVGDAAKPAQILATALILLCLVNTRAYSAARRIVLGDGRSPAWAPDGGERTDFGFSAKWDFLAAPLFFAGLAIVMTWPTITGLGRRLTDEGDPLFNSWVLWRMGENLLGHGAGLYDGNIFHPYPAAMIYSESMIAGAITVLPLRLIGASPVAAHNVLMLIAFAANGLGAYLLALRLTGARPAALLAGALFGFSMPRFGQMGQIQMVCSHFIPLAFLFWIRFLDRPGAARAAAFAAAGALAALSNMHFAVYVFYAMALWALFDVRFGEGRLGEKAKALAIPALVAGAVMIWIFLPYAKSGNQRLLAETLRYANTPFSFINPSQDGALWGPWAVDGPGGHWFPGAVALLMALIGAVAFCAGKTPARRPLAALLLLGLLAAWASMGADFWLYRYMFDYLPGFSGVRNVNRIAIIWLLAVSIFAAAGMAWGLAGLGERARVAVGMALVAMALGESFSPLGEVYTHDEEDSRRFAWLAQRPEVHNILFLPIDPMETPITYASIYHGKKMVNGYSGYFPPLYRELRSKQDEFPTAEMIKTLRDIKVDHVVVESANVNYKRLTRRIEEFGQIAFVEKKNGLALFRISPPAGEPPAR
jgi:hypothetical protein